MTTSIIRSLDSLFIWIQFFVLNLHGWYGIFSKCISFRYRFIILLYQSYIINNFLSLLGDRYLSLGIYLWNLMFSSWFLTVSVWFCGEVLKTFAIVSATLSPVKSPVACAVFWITLSEAVLITSVADCLAWSRSFWLLNLSVKFLLIL